MIVATLLALVCLRPGRSRAHTRREAKAGAKPKSARQAAAAEAAAATAKPRRKKKAVERVCRFCEVAVPKDEMVAAHLSGKRHRKLAGSRAAEECFVWLEKEPPEQELSPEPSSL